MGLRNRQAVIRARTFAALGVVTVAIGCSSASGPSGSSGPVLTPIKGPECIADASRAFIAQNVEPTVPVFPSMPNEGFYLVVRYLGERSISGSPGFDFGRFPADWPAASNRGLPITGLTVPQPRAAWQRAASDDATPDTSSAFQLHCTDAGSWLNTATFARRDIVGGGPHAVYGFAFNNPPPQPPFDRSAGTEFVLQANVEVPWFRISLPPAVTVTTAPIGQVSFFAYFRDRTTRKVFGLIVGIFDNRYGADGLYDAYVAHDTQTPYVSQPLAGASPYVVRAPESQSFTGVAWSGPRFFRARLPQDRFLRAVADVNAWCREHRAMRYCDAPSAEAAAFSVDPLDYEVTDIGVLHEVFRGVPEGDLAMGVHVSDFGAWNLR